MSSFVSKVVKVYSIMRRNKVDTMYITFDILRSLGAYSYASYFVYKKYIGNHG